MGKIYTGNKASQGFSINPTVSQPLDVRTVVEYLTDLTQVLDATGGYSYPGMIVAVIRDENRTGGSSTNNGVYYKENNGNWKKIGEGSSTPIILPQNPGNYILHYLGNGQYEWTEYVEPEPQPTQEFTFNVKEPFVTNNDQDYVIASDESLTQEMTLQNEYDNNNKVADVIAVQDESSIYHLMINPEAQFVLFGGDSEGLERVTLNIQTPNIISEYAVPSGGIGISWLLTIPGAVTTNPVGATLHWFTPEDLENEIQDISQDETISSSEDDPLVRYCYASEDGWLDSLMREVVFKIINDTIVVETTITNITRTTADIDQE